MKKSAFTTIKIAAAVVAVFAVFNIMSTYLNQNTADKKLGVLCYDGCDVNRIVVEYPDGRKTLKKGITGNWFRAMPLKAQGTDMEYTIIVAEGTEQEYRYILKVPADAQWKEVVAILRKAGDSYILTNWEYYS